MTTPAERSLPVADAVLVVELLVVSVLTDAGWESLGRALHDAAQTWPGTDWTAVIATLREPESDAGRVADLLDVEVERERRRLIRLGSPGAQP